jgi:hypothetical protein
LASAEAAKVSPASFLLWYILTKNMPTKLEKLLIKSLSIIRFIFLGVGIACVGFCVYCLMTIWWTGSSFDLISAWVAAILCGLSFFGGNRILLAGL